MTKSKVRACRRHHVGDTLCGENYHYRRRKKVCPRTAEHQCVVTYDVLVRFVGHGTSRHDPVEFASFAIKTTTGASAATIHDVRFNLLSCPT